MSIVAVDNDIKDTLKKSNFTSGFLDNCLNSKFLFVLHTILRTMVNLLDGYTVRLFYKFKMNIFTVPSLLITMVTPQMGNFISPMNALRIAAMEEEKLLSTGIALVVIAGVAVVVVASAVVGDDADADGGTTRCNSEIREIRRNLSSFTLRSSSSNASSSSSSFPKT